MEMQESKNKIKSLLHECLMDYDIDIQQDSHLTKDLGLDSMGFVDLVVKMEGEFNIEIGEEESKDVKTFDDVVSLVTSKLEMSKLAS